MSKPKHGKTSDERLLYGKVNRLFVNQVLFVHEGKITSLDNSAKGRIAQYLYCLHLSGVNNVRGNLFNHIGFMYVETKSGNATKVIEGCWSHDNFNLLRDLIVKYKYPPLTEALIFLCKHFGVRVASSDSVLGQGAYGTVFKVLRGNAEFALKVVLVDVDFLEKEVHYMKLAYERNHDIVVSIEGDCYQGVLSDRLSLFGGYLMTEVGLPISSVNPRNVRPLFEVFHKLHEANLTHNDARLANIVYSKISRSMKLIDFRFSTFDCQCIETSFTKDLRTLTESILKSKDKVVKMQEVTEIVSKYQVKGDEEMVNTIADDVYKLCMKKGNG